MYGIFAIGYRVPHNPNTSSGGASQVVGDALWAAATAYAVGAFVDGRNGYYYRAQSIAGTGTSAGVIPAFPTVIGQTVIDNAGANQITWVCAGINLQYARNNAHYNGGAVVAGGGNGNKAGHPVLYPVRVGRFMRLLSTDGAKLYPAPQPQLIAIP